MLLQLYVEELGIAYNFAFNPGIRDSEICKNGVLTCGFESHLLNSFTILSIFEMMRCLTVLGECLIRTAIIRSVFHLQNRHHTMLLLEITQAQNKDKHPLYNTKFLFLRDTRMVYLRFEDTITAL